MTRKRYGDEVEQKRAEDFGPLFAPVAHARRTDRPTSHEAAKSVTDLTVKQQAVFNFLAGCGPECDAEWIPLYQKYAGLAFSDLPVQSVSGLRSRRAELVQQGKVEAVGEKLIGTRHHTIWRVR